MKSGERFKEYDGGPDDVYLVEEDKLMAGSGMEDAMIPWYALQQPPASIFIASSHQMRCKGSCYAQESLLEAKKASAAPMASSSFLYAVHNSISDSAASVGEWDGRELVHSKNK